MDSDSGRRVIIVGGGTAGWMAANLMAKHWQGKDFGIALVESPRIATVGVGEGSTPPFRCFLDAIGLRESEWMPQCKATYKVGIAFRHWSTVPGGDCYFHPFLTQLDHGAAFLRNSLLRRNGVDVDAHPDGFFLNARLAQERKAPVAPAHFPFELNYSYHFDAALLGRCLAAHAQRLGVARRECTITEVLRDGRGAIAGLRTDQGDTLTADLYVDCTGFRGQLLQQGLGVPFLAFSDTLFNDSAVVLLTTQEHAIPCQTVATALRAGWAWAIPLTHRTGNGYVYSSAFCGADEAERELREHLGLLDSPVQARHLRMKVGRVSQPWAWNCLAVGLAQGFVEPLEATALDLVKQTVERFLRAYGDGRFEAADREEFNAGINGLCDAVHDYIACHYKSCIRQDTEYWRSCAANAHVPPALAAVYDAWFAGRPLQEVLEREGRDRYFPAISWECLLAGYGVFPPAEQLARASDGVADPHPDPGFLRACALNFPLHREQLERLCSEARPPRARTANG